LESGYTPYDFIGLLPKGVSVSERAPMRYAFESCEEESKGKFREGVVNAFTEWNPKEYTLGILAHLIYLAEDTKTTGALTHIVSLIDQQELSLDSDEAESVMSASIATVVWLSDFCGDEEKQENISLLKKWFDDPYYEDFSGMIMNGICIFEPDEFPELFPRFLEVAEKHPGYFILDACIRES